MKKEDHSCSFLEKAMKVHFAVEEYRSMLSNSNPDLKATNEFASTMRQLLT